MYHTINSRLIIRKSMGAQWTWNNVIFLNWSCQIVSSMSSRKNIKKDKKFTRYIQKIQSYSMWCKLIYYFDKARVTKSSRWNRYVDIKWFPRKRTIQKVYTICSIQEFEFHENQFSLKWRKLILIYYNLGSNSLSCCLHLHPHHHNNS